MASFLVTKLLEQAMLEAAKDKSKMSEADALALLDTLQKMSATKTAQEENSSSSWQAADDATRGQSSGKNELDDVDLLMQVAGEDIAKTPLATESPQNEVLVVVEENPVIMAKDKNIEKGMQVVTTASAPLQENPPVLPGNEDEKFQRSLLAARIRNDAFATGKMMKVMDLKVPAVVSPTDLPPVVDDFTATTTMPRIPDVISKDFGKPLEVMAYDVPALRDSSSPYKSVQCKSECCLPFFSLIHSLITC